MPGSPVRHRRLAAALCVAVAFGLCAPPGTGEAQTGTSDDTAAERRTAEVIITADPRVEDDLGAVALDGTEYRAAVEAYGVTEARLTEAEATIETAIADLRALLAARERLDGELVGAQRRRLKDEIRLAVVRADLRDLAVGQYVQGGLGGPVEEIVDLEAANERGSQRVFVDAVQQDRLSELRFLTRHLADQATIESAAQAEVDVVARRITETERIRDDATTRRDQASTELVVRRQAVADSRLMSAVVDLDFRFVNFNAYYRAARTIRAEQPSCGLRWTALAAIARTESNHGTYNGTQPDADGNIEDPITGIALDGSNGTASIGDTDGGEIDGDPNGDRAVGPMQFIPSTWKAVARDGNGDGKADPHNLYDATLTAAAYLCRQGPGLDTDAGLRRGFRSYNNDGSYVELVLSRAHAYDAYEVPPLAPGLPSPSPAIEHPDDVATTTTSSPPDDDTEPTGPEGTEPG